MGRRYRPNRRDDVVVDRPDGTSMSKDASDVKSHQPACVCPGSCLSRRCLPGDIPLDRALDPRPRSARVANDVDSARSKVAKEEGGVRRDDQGRRPGAADRAGHPHPAVPALQHSLGLADPDAADRRLSVRVEIHLRLLEAFDSVQPAAVLRAASGPPSPSAATSPCSSCRATIRPTTSSASSACRATASR